MQTAALTVPRVRSTIAWLLRRALRLDEPTYIARIHTRWLRRNETARFYHWKRHNRLAPLVVPQRE